MLNQTKRFAKCVTKIAQMPRNFTFAGHLYIKKFVRFSLLVAGEEVAEPFDGHREVSSPRQSHNA